MSMAQLRELLDDRAQLLPLTVEQYHRMIEIGILPEGEPYELLDGYVVRKDRSAAGGDPMTVGEHHAWVVRRLAKLSASLESRGCDIQTQLPIILSRHNQPEPDGAVVVGSIDDYRHRHPGPGDVLCVIEVSDASLRRDQGTKRRLYAEAEIGQYVVVNLPERVVEVYTDPLVGEGVYKRCDTLGGGESLPLPTAAEPLMVPVSELLP